MSVKIEKLWFNSSQCLFCLFLNKSKQYLTINYSGKTNYILSPSKPKDFLANLELSIQIRKSFKGFRFEGIYLSPQFKKKFWLSFIKDHPLSNEPKQLLRLEVEPHLHQSNLMNLSEQTSLLRCKKNKVYTKIWQLKDKIEPQDNLENIINSIKNTETNEISANQIQKTWIKKLKRRRKTLRVSLDKILEVKTDQNKLKSELDSIYQALSEESDQSHNSLGPQIDEIYAKIKKDNKREMVNIDLVKKLESHLIFLDDTIESFNQGEDIDTNVVKEFLGIDLIGVNEKKVSKRKDRDSKFLANSRGFELDSNWKVFISKSAKNADLLLKNTPSNATVLHVANNRGGFGVVIGKNNRAQLPDQLLQNAAILCLHFSKQRDDLGGDVYLTKRSNLKKTKGLGPGKWLIERAESISIKYQQSSIRSLLDLRI